MATLVEIAKEWNFDATDIRIYDASLALSAIEFEYTGEYRAHLTHSTDPRYHANWKHFKSACLIADKLNVSVDRYLRVIFFRVSEDDSSWTIFPNMIHSKWAINRFNAFNPYVPWVVTAERKSLNDIELITSSRFAIDRMMKRVNSSWNYPRDFQLYLQHNTEPVHPIFEQILFNTISLKFLSVSKTFNEWIETIPADVVREYIDVEKLERNRLELLINSSIKTALQEALTTDLGV
ncbi:MAG: hypothetical protein PHU64_07735 [Candidatus Omnitrophica bacterium]|nr:hypothetical protein [Candidatus Omnitrophota bacterium]